MPTIGTQLNVIIDPDKRDRFKNKVRGEGKTVNDVINELIDSYLEMTDVKCSDLNFDSTDYSNGFSTPVTIRIPDRILEQLQDLANTKYPSRTNGKGNRSQVILDAIEFYLSSRMQD